MNITIKVPGKPQTWTGDDAAARDALKALGMNSDRARSLIPLFTEVVELPPSVVTALVRARVIKSVRMAPTEPRALSPSALQRLYDRLFVRMVEEVRGGLEDMESDRGGEEGGADVAVELAETVFFNYSRELAPMMAGLGLRKSRIVWAVAEAAAG